eukprot:Nk52_evm1s2469 gene=Nk52_evmTU1s2469
MRATSFFFEQTSSFFKSAAAGSGEKLSAFKSVFATTSLPKVTLGNLADNPGARKKAVRVGRGGSRGKTSGRGHKGQGQRGTKKGPLFEGGQTPLYMRIPKRGFSNRPFMKEYERVGLGKLQYFIDMGKIDPTEKITLKTLRDAGVVSKSKVMRDGVKLLGTGGERFVTPVDIEVNKATPTAIGLVEKMGGKITTRFFDRIGLKVVMKPHKFPSYKPLPKLADPMNAKDIQYYTNPDNRGYLVDRIESLPYNPLSMHESVRHRVPAQDWRGRVIRSKGDGNNNDDNKNKARAA